MATPTKQPLSLGGTYQIANGPAPQRLVVAVDGREKSGKTNFLFSAPGPIAYLSFDTGDEGVIQKFQGDKVIHKASYEATVAKGLTHDQIMDKIRPVWESFVADYQLAIAKAKAGEVRTIGVDTASEVWEVLRLARIGKLTQVMPHHYTALNAEYRALVKEIYNTPANLILLHKLKAEWADNSLTGKSSKTGGYERAGYADTGFLVQVNVTAWREQLKDDPKGTATGPFHLTVKDSRQNPSIAGDDLVEPLVGFAHLASLVYPDSAFDDWL